MKIAIDSISDVSPAGLKSMLEMTGSIKNIKIGNGGDLLIRCFKENRTDLLDTLFEYIDVKVRYGGGTALCWAIFVKMEKFAERLLEAGSDPDAVDEGKKIINGSPLWYSIEYQLIDIFKLLLKKGATVTEELLKKVKDGSFPAIYVRLLEERFDELNTDVVVKKKELTAILNAMVIASDAINIAKDGLHKLLKAEEHAHIYEQQLQVLEKNLDEINCSITEQIIKSSEEKKALKKIKHIDSDTCECDKCGYEEYECSDTYNEECIECGYEECECSDTNNED